MDGDAVPGEPGSDGAVRLVFGFTIEQTLRAEPDAIFVAWTEAFDTWFALPGSISMTPRVGEPYWFDVEHGGERHPHYGRFIALEPASLVVQTWVTGRGGTDGSETLLTIELESMAPGTRVRLTHSGFYDEAASDRHATAWPQILDHLDEVLSSGI